MQCMCDSCVIHFAIHFVTPFVIHLVIYLEIHFAIHLTIHFSIHLVMGSQNEWHKMCDSLAIPLAQDVWFKRGHIKFVIHLMIDFTIQNELCKMNDPPHDLHKMHNLPVNSLCDSKWIIQNAWFTLQFKMSYKKCEIHYSIHNESHKMCNSKWVTQNVQFTSWFTSQFKMSLRKCTGHHVIHTKCMIHLVIQECNKGDEYFVVTFLSKSVSARTLWLANLDIITEEKNINLINMIMLGADATFMLEWTTVDIPNSKIESSKNLYGNIVISYCIGCFDLFSIITWLLLSIHRSAGSRISRRGHQPRRGCQLPRQLRFKKFVCQNKRIWTLGGGARRRRPPWIRQCIGIEFKGTFTRVKWMSEFIRSSLQTSWIRSFPFLRKYPEDMNKLKTTSTLLSSAHRDHLGTSLNRNTGMPVPYFLRDSTCRTGPRNKNTTALNVSNFFVFCRFHSDVSVTGDIKHPQFTGTGSFRFVV